MRWVVVLLIVAALGAGYGLGVLSQSDTGGGAGRAERSAQTPTGSGTAPSSSSSSKGGWDELVASLGVEQPAPGSGKIVGRVVDENGDGVEGAVVVVIPVVRAGSHAASASQGPPEPAPLVDLVKQFAKRESRVRAGTREAATDVDGMYEFTRLGGATYNVRAYKKGHRMTATHRRGGWGVKPDAEVNFKAKRVVRIDVDVTLSDGSRPNHANILCTVRTDSGSMRTGASWSSGAPWIELAPGTYSLHATLGDGSSAKSDEESIVVDPDDPPAPISLRIVVKPSMRITIVPPPGFGTVKAYPVMLRFSGDTPPPDDVLRDARRESSLWPDQDGRALAQNLEPGRYLVGASLSPGGAIVARKVAEVSDGQVEVALELPAPDPSKYSLLRPLGPDGKPLRGLNWLGIFRGKRRSGSSGCSALYRADGVAFVSRLDRYDGMPGKRSVVGTHRDYGAITVEVDPASTEPVTMQFRKAAFVDTVVAGYRGSGREGRLVVSISQPGQRRRTNDKTPDSEGKVAMGPVQPGDYLLRLHVSGSPYGNTEIASSEVSLRSGRQAATLAIPPLYELKVTWIGKGKPTFMLERNGERGRRRGRGHSREVDANGVATFRDLLAGEYRVVVANVSERVEPRAVTVPGTAALTLP